MVKFDITDLKEGEVIEEMTTPSAEQLDLDPDTFSDIEVIATLQKIEDRIEVNFDARAVATLQGDRTLQWYDEPVNGSFAITFKPLKDITEDEEDDETIREYAPFDPDVDITQEVRDTLLLALPLRQIAPGGEEEELQLEYGTPDDSEDGAEMPEWKQKLKELREDRDSE